jgi:hypothetical protein
LSDMHSRSEEKNEGESGGKRDFVLTSNQPIAIGRQ